MKISKNVKRIVLLVFAFLFVVGIVCGTVFCTKELSKNNYYNINKKTARFLKNEDFFNNSLDAVLSGNIDELEIESVENGTVEYIPSDTLKKYNVKSVAGRNSVIDYCLDTSLYASGYLFSENDDNVFPVQIDDADLIDEEYVQQDDGTLIKGSYKDQKSYSENWLVVKQINDNWYYYEYHSN